MSPTDNGSTGQKYKWPVNYWRKGSRKNPQQTLQQYYGKSSTKQLQRKQTRVPVKKKPDKLIAAQNHARITAMEKKLTEQIQLKGTRAIFRYWEPAQDGTDNNMDDKPLDFWDFPPDRYIGPTWGKTSQVPPPIEDLEVLGPLKPEHLVGLTRADIYGLTTREIITLSKTRNGTLEHMIGKPGKPLPPVHMYGFYESESPSCCSHGNDSFSDSSSFE